MQSNSATPNFTTQSKMRGGLHVAVIMDGNGRWATRRGLPRAAGHRAGVAAVRRVVEHAPELGIGTLTVYAFSADNWRRPGGEVQTIFWLLRAYLRLEREKLRKQGARLEAIGRRDRIPRLLLREIVETEAATAGCDRLHLRVAIDYSSRDAIAMAAARVLAQESGSFSGAKAPESHCGPEDVRALEAAEKLIPRGQVSGRDFSRADTGPLFKSFSRASAREKRHSSNSSAASEARVLRIPDSSATAAVDALRPALTEALTADCGEVDLLIRTGGEKRLSDFLLWESAYAELYFTDRMWPEFGAADLEAAIAEFRHRQRRFGGVPDSALAPGTAAARATERELVRTSPAD